MKPESAAQHDKNDNSNQLIQNIDDAKNWLDKAKDEFVDLNKTRGELNLSLAQAEVQRAWELSREQCVVTLRELQPEKAVRAPRKNALLLPLAAGLGIMTLILGAVYWVRLQQPGLTIQRAEVASHESAAPKAPLSIKSTPAQPVSPQNVVVKTAPVVRVKSSPQVVTANLPVHPIKRRQEAPKQKKAVLEPPVVDKIPVTVKNETVDDKDVRGAAATVAAAEPPTVKETPAVKEAPGVAAAENPRKSNPTKVEAAAAVNSGRLHPVLQLPEDDLANIAKRSLKNGR